jgi:hypothetical protein
MGTARPRVFRSRTGCEPQASSAPPQERMSWHLTAAPCAPARSEAGEAVVDGLEALPHGVEMVEAFAQAEVAQIVGAELGAEEAGELLILPQQSVLPVGAEDVMAVLDLLDQRQSAAFQVFLPNVRRIAAPVPPPVHTIVEFPQRRCMKQKQASDAEIHHRLRPSPVGSGI